MYSLSKYSLSKYFILASLCLLIASNSLAQSTTVSGQVTDSGGQSWNSGTYMFQFIPNNNFPSSTYSWTGGVLNQIITGSLNGTGGYSQSVPSSTSITPSLSQWRLQVCSGTTPVNCFSVTQTITGGSQTVNVTPPPVVVPPGAGNTAYVTGEVSPATVGSQIYIIGTGLQVCSTVVAGACTTWVGASGSSTLSIIDASSSPYNVKGTGGVAVLCTLNNTSAAVTCTDANFTGIAGMSLFCTNGQGYNTVILGATATTILSGSGTTLTASQAATGSVAGTGSCGWGTPQTLGARAAFAAEHALTRCGAIRWPAGYLYIDGDIYGSQNSLCNSFGNVDWGGEDIGGQGEGATFFVLSPVFGNGSFISNLPANQQAPILLHDLHITGLGNSGYTGTLLDLRDDSHLQNIKLESIGGKTASNSVKWTQCQSCSMHNTFFQNVGQIVVQTGDQLAMFNTYWNGQLLITGGEVNDYGAMAFQQTAGLFAGIVDNSHGGTYNCFGSLVGTNTGGLVSLRMGLGSIARLNSCDIGVAGAGASYGIFWDTGGGTVYSRGGTTISAGSNGALNNVSNNTPAIFEDDGTTVFNGPLSTFTTGTVRGPNVFTGIGTGTCTSSVTVFLASPGSATNACTNTTATNATFIAPRAGTLSNMYCSATTAGSLAGSGVVTLRTAPLSTGTFSNSTITATFGTTTTANDVTHTVAVTAGQPIQFQVVLAAGETLAGVSCSVYLHN